MLFPQIHTDSNRFSDSGQYLISKLIQRSLYTDSNRFKFLQSVHPESRIPNPNRNPDIAVKSRWSVIAQILRPTSRLIIYKCCVDLCGLCGSLWIFVDICGSLWIFVDLCGYLWIFVDIESSLIYMLVDLLLGLFGLWLS